MFGHVIHFGPQDGAYVWPQGQYLSLLTQFGGVH